MTDDKAARGMKKKYGVSNTRVSITIIPVNKIIKLVVLH